MPALKNSDWCLAKVMQFVHQMKSDNVLEGLRV